MGLERTVVGFAQAGKRSATVGSISGGYTDVCMRNKRSSVVVSATEPSGDLDI